MIRIVIAEDHNTLIDGMKSFFSNEKDIQLVGCANNGRELCDLVSLKKPDIVVTDIRMPIMDGITATKELLKISVYTKVIALTMFDQDEAVGQMIAAGAKGYLLKNANLIDLVKAIRIVYMGGTYFDSAAQLREGTEESKSELLSKRQIEILKLVALGKTNQEIADQLFIGKLTVETHRKNMIRILNLKGAGELLRYALERKYAFK